MKQVLEIPLIYAELKSQMYSEFHIPSKKKRSNCKIGEFVKVSDGKDRFWVKIEAINNVFNSNIYIASIQNYLINGQSYDYGDMIYVVPGHIIDIMNEKYISWVKTNNLQGIHISDSTYNAKK